MKLASPIQTLKQAEPWILCIFIISFSGVSVPPLVQKGLNLFSYIMVIPIVLRQWKHILYLLTKDKVLLLFHVLAFSSIAWSIVPEITLLRFIAVLRTSLVGVLLATYTPKEQAQLFTRVFMICGLLSLFAVVALPSYGIAYGGANGGSWRGVFVFKNALGMMMALGATLSSLRLIFTRQYFRITVLSLIGAVILIIFSQSATSLVAFVAATLLIPMQKIVKQYYKLRVVLYIFAILASLALAVLVINNLNLIVEDFLGKSLTLTGRDTLWKAIIDQGLQRPWSGYGYSAFWYSDASLDAVANNPTGWPALPPSGQYLTSFHSHNGYVELFVQLGYPGLILVGASCLTVLFRIIQFLSITKAIEGLWMLQIILMMLITNYTEVPTFMAANQLQWILYVSISFSTALQLERIKRGTKITKKEVKRAFLPQPTNITG